MSTNDSFDAPLYPVDDLDGSGGIVPSFVYFPMIDIAFFELSSGRDGETVTTPLPTDSLGCKVTLDMRGGRIVGIEVADASRSLGYKILDHARWIF